MWKDFFSFSKRERTTLVLLTLVILLMQVLLWTRNSWLPYLPGKLKAMHEEKVRMDLFRDSVMRSERIRQANGYRFRQKRSYKDRFFEFDPNRVDSGQMARLGLREYVIRNILKYRSKGGFFRTADDLAHIYGMSPVFFERLRPYVRFDQQAPEERKKGSVLYENASGGTSAPLIQAPLLPAISRLKNSFAANSDEKKAAAVKIDAAGVSDAGMVSKPDAGTRFDAAGRLSELNAADTTALLMLKGVGRFTAFQIERYKQQLGGFYSVNQLAEIKNIYPETLKRLQAQFAVNPAAIRQLDVNHASLEALRSHPYLSFYQAKVIVELRKARGRILSLDELSGYKEFTTDDLGRLRWYLRFG